MKIKIKGYDEELDDDDVIVIELNG